MPKSCPTRLPPLFIFLLLLAFPAVALDNHAGTVPAQVSPQISSTGAVILDVRRLTAQYLRDGGVVLWDVHFNRPVTVSKSLDSGCRIFHNRCIRTSKTVDRLLRVANYKHTR